MSKAEKKKNAERMRRVRAERDRKRQCRTCGRPVARSARTGAPAKLCRKHLDADLGRKLVYVLMKHVPDDNRKGFDSQLWYPLAWAGRLPS